MVAKGKSIFTGTGLCLACHGMEAKGGIGPDLTDQTWLHGDGSYEAIVKLITTGVGTEESKTGQIMPPKGGSTISPEEVKIVAAYVWKLSRK
jgi:cytochrome c oxidase cbb3-type subunit 3